MIIPAGAAQINYVFTGAGAPLGAEWTIGFDGVAGLTTTQLATRARDAWDTHIRPRVSNQVTLSAVRVKFGPNETGPSTELATNLAGGNASTTAAPNTAYLIHKATALGGRRGRGRAFHPGVDEASMDNGGVIPAATVTAWNTALASYLTAMETPSGDLVVLHAPGNSTMPVPTPITQMTVDAKVATQRRRLRR